MKWEDVDSKYCPTWPDLAWKIERKVDWEDRPLCVVKSGMGTGKSHQEGIASVRGFDRWVYENIEMIPLGFVESRCNQWRELLDDLRSDRKTLIGKLYLVKSPPY